MKIAKFVVGTCIVLIALCSLAVYGWMTGWGAPWSPDQTAVAVPHTGCPACAEIKASAKTAANAKAKPTAGTHSCDCSCDACEGCECSAGTCQCKCPCSCGCEKCKCGSCPCPQAKPKPEASKVSACPCSTHFCAEGCSCGCTLGEPCKCDGRHCPVEIFVPGNDPHWLRTTVEIDSLPRQKTPCQDRPLSEGVTWKNTGAAYFPWITNDPNNVYDHRDFVCLCTCGDSCRCSQCQCSDDGLCKRPDSACPAGPEGPAGKPGPRGPLPCGCSALCPCGCNDGKPCSCESGAPVFRPITEADLPKPKTDSNGYPIRRKSCN